MLVTPFNFHPGRIFVRKFFRRFSDSGLVFSTNETTEISKMRIPHSKTEFIQKMLHFKPYNVPDSKLLKIAVIGFPNSGKSSLVNMLTQWRVCAVSGKVHTTRSKQTVVFTKDNVQLAFMDLPGIVSLAQTKQFNLEKTFIRDPHAAVFDSDIVLIVVDSSNKYARKELHPEILKTLHFFSDKESILVLNKVDKSKGDPTRLLEATRVLTNGLVNGVSCHLDAFQNRFNHRAFLEAKNPCFRHLTAQEEIFRRLPQEAHDAADRVLTELKRLKSLLAPPVQIELTKLPSPALPTLASPDTYSPIDHDTQAATLDDSCSTLENSDRLISDVDRQIIDEYFESYKPDTSLIRKAFPEKKTIVSDPALVDQHSEVYLESIMEQLKNQLLLNTVTKEEVKARKERWRQLSIDLRGAKSWNGFKEVFMVSSATGFGVDNLRNFLIGRAIPERPWILSPNLVTDHEPTELIRMCVWAHCLDQLPKDVPYSLSFLVDECERERLQDGDDRLYVHARIRCRTERHLKIVLGVGGLTIRSLANSVKLELADMFRAPTVVKLTAEMIKPSSGVMRHFKKTSDIKELFTDYDKPVDNSLSNIEL